MSDGCIYLVTNKSNNKKYIGQHHKPDPKKRWAQHKRSKDNCAFAMALRKYGPDNFTWEVLLICPHNKLTEMEGYYAEVFETYTWDTPGGYNSAWCSITPNLGLKASLDTLKKISQTSLGRKWSQESKEKASQSHAGRKQTPEHTENSRQARLGKKRSPEAIKNMCKPHIGMRGKKMPPEAVEKSRQAKIGKKRSPETIEKLKQAWIRRKENAKQKVQSLSLEPTSRR